MGIIKDALTVVNEKIQFLGQNQYASVPISQDELFKIKEALEISLEN